MNDAHDDVYRQEDIKFMPILNWLGKEKVVGYPQQVPNCILEPRFQIKNENAEYKNNTIPRIMQACKAD
jgi:hypothetical protein